MRSIFVRVCLLLSCYIVSYCPQVFAKNNNDLSFYFLAFADIHFDPFAACYGKTVPCSLLERLRAASVNDWPMMLSAGDQSAPRYRRDTNYVLLTQSLLEAKTAAKKNHADFVLVLGDTLGHDFQRYYKKYTRDKKMIGYRDFVHKTLEFVNRELSRTFPDTSVFMVTGNNDTYSRNYQSVPRGLFFARTGALWSTLIKDADSRAAMRRAFSAGGYYAVDVPGDSAVRLIVLNSVLFSVKAIGAAAEQAASDQLGWLHDQLQQAKQHHQRILIALHIPPGIDVYATRRWRLFTLLEFWKSDPLARFKRELAPYHSQIIAIFSGHLHYDWSQSLRVDGLHDIPVVSVPSVSPFFGNDPSFKIYHYSAVSGGVNEIDTYTFSVSGERTSSLEHAYRLLNH